MRNWPKVLLAASSLALSLGIAEVGLQVVFRLKHGDWIFREGAAFRVHFTQPVSDARRYALRPGYSDEQVTINGLGFRGALIPPGQRRQVVAVLGDSVPFGAGVADDENYPHLLEGELRERGLSLSVLNAAVPSYNLRQSLDRLRIDVTARYHPRLVVIHAANDVTLLAAYRERWTPEVTWAERRWSKHWRRWSYAFGIPRLLNRVARREWVEAQSFGPYPTGELVGFLYKLLEARLGELEQQGVSIVLVPLNPFYYQLDNKERNRSLPLFQRENYSEYAAATEGMFRDVNSLLQRVAERWPHVRFFELRERMDAARREQLYLDFLHYTPDGNRVVAKALAEFLASD